MEEVSFQLAVPYSPKGDQKNAIAELSAGLAGGEKHQVLLGVTGSGKTFTMAKLIEKSGRPALVLAHNKTLAAQLYHEFKSFFPSNAVEYFVSYYDYYHRKPTSHRATFTSRRKPPLTTNSTVCVSRLHDPYSNAAIA